MSYNLNKIIKITILLLSFAAGPSFAQNDMEAMKFLTISELMQYGQKLYDRGDYPEASAVFNHVLQYDNRQPSALDYLKRMGHSPLSIPEGLPTIKMVPVSLPEMSNVVKPKTELPILNTVNMADTVSLKEAIKAKKIAVEKLQVQIEQMRARIATLQQKEDL